MVKTWLVLHGGSTDYRSHYATSSAVHYRGMQQKQPSPATPWMGEPQSRVGYLTSGYQSSFIRDKPPGDGSLDDLSASRETFAARIVSSDSSGYHYQIKPKPIPNDVGM